MNDMLLVIMLAGRRAVLPAIVVNSVIELAEVTPVPRAAAHVAGLAALRRISMLTIAPASSPATICSRNSTPGSGAALPRRYAASVSGTRSSLHG